jgi:hypothetical protein
MKRLACCFLILYLFAGCNKNKDQAVVYSVALSDKALAYVKLQQGRYFIYKDSTTGQQDSVVVTASLLETVFVPEYHGSWVIVPAHNLERFSLTLSRISAGGASSLWFQGAAEPFFNIPFASSDTAAVDMREPDNTPVFYMSHSSQPSLSMTVEGRNYSNVVVTANESIGDINHPFYKKTIYYWASGTGIIKRTLVTTGGTTTTYTLLRNN